MIQNETFVEEAVDSGKKMFVIKESKNRDLSLNIEIIKKGSDEDSGSASILPVRATVVVRDGQSVKAGDILVKIPRDAGKTRDITGGLPRIAELFEARNPSDPAVVTEIDGKIKFGGVKRGVREINVINKQVTNVYKIPYGKHILVQEGDFVAAGDRLCEGAISPRDILSIRGPAAVQEYLVNSIQEVYRLQGVKINDKHIEIIVRQMMLKVEVKAIGNSDYLPGDRVNKNDLLKNNELMKTKVVVSDPGDSDYLLGDVVALTNIDDLNAELKADKKIMIQYKKAKPATYKPLLLGITRASLNTESFISAASFQETTRVLTDAAVEGKTDNLNGLKENVIIGRLIPAGTGLSSNQEMIVTSNSEDSNEFDSVENQELADYS